MFTSTEHTFRRTHAQGICVPVSYQKNISPQYTPSNSSVSKYDVFNILILRNFQRHHICSMRVLHVRNPMFFTLLLLPAMTKGRIKETHGAAKELKKPRTVGSHRLDNFMSSVILINLSIYLSMYLSIYLPIYLSTYLSIYISIYRVLALEINRSS